MKKETPQNDQHLQRQREELVDADATVRDLRGRTTLMKGRTGRSALMRAAARGDVEGLRQLLPTSDAMAADGDGWTALMLAAALGNTECVRELLPESDATATKSGGLTALMIAASNGRADCAGELLPASDAKARDAGGKSALGLAIRGGHAECADLLAEHSEREAAGRAFKKFGATKMPRWAARLEAEALRKEIAANRGAADAKKDATPTPRIHARRI